MAALSPDYPLREPAFHLFASRVLFGTALLNRTHSKSRMQDLSAVLAFINPHFSAPLPARHIGACPQIFSENVGFALLNILQNSQP